jgi:transposase
MEQQSQRTRRPRRKYTQEFKQAAVDLVIKQGYSLAEAARRLDVAENNIVNWKHQLARSQARETAGTLESILVENRDLKDRNRRLEMECEILKKAATYFATANQPDLLSSPRTRPTTRST